MRWQIQGGDAIGQAVSVARGFAEAEWLTEDEAARLCIIVEELVANLYDHAGLKEDDRVWLGLNAELDGIHLVIEDNAPAFDPRSAAPGQESQRGGGAGIDIVQAWAEIREYRVAREGNRLEVVMPVGFKG